MICKLGQRSSCKTGFDLNVELAPIDRRSDHFINRLALATQLGKPVSLDEVSKAVYEAMLSAHHLALETCRLRRRLYKAGMIEMSDAQIKKILNNSTKTDKDALRELYGSIARSVTNKSMSKVREDLMKAAIGEVNNKPKQADKSLKSALGATGPNKKASPVLRTVFRTQTAIAYNAAAWIETQDDDDVWGYEYTTAGDERVRDTHEELDGLRYPKSDPFWDVYSPPNGWNCRCSPVPIYRGEKNARKKTKKTLPPVDKAFKTNFGKIFSVSV